MAFKPIVAARDGSRGLCILEYEGAERAANGHAEAYYYRIRTEPNGDSHRVGILFSYSVPSMTYTDYGVPSTYNVKQARQTFAEARLGDFLDEGGEFDFAAKPQDIQCYSQKFDEWSKRSPANDDEIEAYLRSKAFWTWSYAQDEFVVSHADYIRLRVRPDQVMKIVRLYDGMLWKAGEPQGHLCAVAPASTLIFEEKQKRQQGLIVEIEPPARPNDWVFVDHTRLDQLNAVDSDQFDLSRLVCLCEELNVASRNAALHSIAMLTRAVMDHIPPIFGKSSFGEVADQHGGSSFKDSMRHLERSARKIADGHLHTQIRRRETLPTPTQVDFSRELDVLLGEIVRLLR
jgi:hypothetical protein